MCFSASASFGASAVLSVIGVSAIVKVQQPKQIIFAAIPFVFAFQQFSEGIVWYSMMHENYAAWIKPASTVFLFLAQVLWPSWVPLSMLLIEKNTSRKKILGSLLVLGGGLSVYLAYALFISGFSTSVEAHHIHYELQYPHNLPWWAGIIYFLPIGVSPFISSVKKMPFIGVLTFLTFAITKLFFLGTSISVWCFFAAVMSMVVYVVMKDFKRNAENEVVS